jgi:hypothetical protein
VRLPRVSSPGCGALALLSAFLLPALSGCGASGGAATTAVQQRELARAEARATDAEAEAQRLREQLDELKAQQAQARRSAADDGGGAGGAAEAEGASGGGTLLPAAAHASFAALARSLPGEAGLAVSPVGSGQPVEQLGSLQQAVAWSTSKVPVAMAALDAGVGSSGDLRQAITASDNAAAMRLWQALGGGRAAAAAANDELRAAGDDATAIEARTLRAGFTPFGQTRWALADQVRFTAGMACLDAGGQLLGLMHETIPAQRWGLGSAGVPAELKGGWGPGSEPGANGGYVDRQMGVMTIHGRPLAVTLLARPSDGAHATGTTMLTQLARWVVGHANVRGLPRRARC